MGAGTQGQGTAVDVLRAPIRIRILEACTVLGRLSPSEIVKKRLAADIASMEKKTFHQQVSHVSYHCRKLEEANLLLLVDELKVRGATEHFYRAKAEAYFSDSDWAALPQHERSPISRVMWQGLVGRVESAMIEDTFDARPDRWLAWVPLELDEKAWEEVGESVARCYTEIDRISLEAKRRLEESGEASMPATFGVLSFESPTASGWGVGGDE